MRVRVQVVIEAGDAEDERPLVVHEVAQIERGELGVATLGLHLAEAKDLLQKVQAVVSTNRFARAWPNRCPVPAVAEPEPTRTPRRSLCAPCSARCASAARVGTTVLASRS